jgi:hypothetical protein
MLLDDELRSKKDIVDRIKDLKDWKGTQLKELHDRMEKRRNRYYLDHYPATEKEEGEERVHIASEMRLVDKAYGLLTIEKPTIKAYPEEETEPGLEESDRLESWLEGVNYEQRRRQGVDPWGLGAMDMLITSMACIFTYWDTSLDTRTNWQAAGGQGAEDEATAYMEQFYGMAPQEETGPRLGELPIIVKRRDPIKVYPHEGGNQGRWQWVMYVDKIAQIDVETEWRDALGGKPLEGSKSKGFVEKTKNPVTVIDCWSWENDPETGEPVLYNAVVAGDQLVKPPTPMRKYRQMPFEIFFCRTTPEPQWERKGLPITAQMEKTAPELEAAWNTTMRRAKLHAQLPILHYGTTQDIDIAAGFGKVIHMGPDPSAASLGPMEYGSTPPDYDRMTGMLHREVEAGGLGSPVMGEMGGKESGYALALRGEAGTLNLVAPQQSLSLAMSNVFQQVCSLAAEFAPDHEMRVMGQYENQRKVFALTGEQCQGWFIDVGVEAQFPEDKDRKMAWGMQLAMQPKEQRVLDERTITEEFFGYKNYDQMKDRRLQELAESHPAVTASEMAEALRKRGMEHLLPLIFPELAQQQPGGVPGAAAPTSLSVPGVPTQVMPQERMGAMRSQEMLGQPKGRMFPEEELEEQRGFTTA